ncbi:hypothetical protein J7T55_003721 [Diaporthe amygdali]|uniref:uncharacterized protein n=1 Tax=Phomopsis amygdali TaxID=1214568 RepID=UPI0022FDB797|nr:uncharacterized protein J7T55_003721 [Diaporthe amygdali]KAJ0117309.1 hypothetical protein J7T55_003721 [Diaporthe amygdali]
MVANFNILVITSIMLVHDALCLPQRTQADFAIPPTVTTQGVGGQPNVGTSTTSSKSSLVTHLTKRSSSSSTPPPIDRTDAHTETMTTITRSDGRIQTLPIPYPLPTIEPPSESDTPELSLTITEPRPSGLSQTQTSDYPMFSPSDN